MKETLPLLLILALAPLAHTQTRVNFDSGRELPKGWQSGVTGKGTCKWEVTAEDSAPSPPMVLKQSGEATFCWCAKTDESIRDGFAEVKFKPIFGKEDQAGGLVFRFKDALRSPELHVRRCRCCRAMDQGGQHHSVR